MRMRGRVTLALALAILAGAACGARSERLVASLSSQTVSINSSFKGADLVLFGTAESDAASAADPYDIVVTVTGPRQDMVARRKGRVLGIWVNTESHTFVDAPSYLAVLANRPLESIASEATLRRLNIGLARTPIGDGGESADNDAFRAAFIDVNRAHGTYRELTDAVTFLTSALFRTTIQLPADVPIGIYEIDVKLFSGGTPVARQGLSLKLVKVGFEQFIAGAARDQGTLYGLATVLLALVTGWLASVVFRRD